MSAGWNLLIRIALKATIILTFPKYTPVMLVQGRFVKYIPMDINVLRHKKTHTGRCKSACMSIKKQGFS
jgi:hypothetical protein